jgi:hypothetical protein
MGRVSLSSSPPILLLEAELLRALHLHHHPKLLGELADLLLPLADRVFRYPDRLLRPMWFRPPAPV